jgi:uncharacterized integral membrane protein
MSIRVIIGLAIVLIVVLFAVQNTEPVGLHLLFWEVSAPAAVAVAVAFACGVLTGVLFVWREQRRTRRQQQLIAQAGGTATPAAALTTTSPKQKKQSWWW